MCLDHQPVTFSYLANCFISNKMYPFLAPSLKITSGEISADEQQGRVEAKQRNITDKKLSRQSAHQNNLNHFKSILQKSKIPHCLSHSINAPIKPPSNPSSSHHPHPEERIWGGRTPPAAAPGPGRSEDQVRQDETILHG